MLAYETIAAGVAVQQFVVHVVDTNCHRRARIARTLYSRSFHAEIYEDIEELVQRCPGNGGILIADEASRGAGSIKIFRSKNGHLPVTCFSVHPSPEQVAQAMRSGALDYLQWPFSLEALDAAMTRLQVEGGQQAKMERRKAQARQLVDGLTRRERDVLEGVLSGESNKENAKRLGISSRTVEIHRSHMMPRLNADSISDAVRIGLYAGLE